MAFNKDQTVNEVVQSGRVIRFSRIPIYGKDLDDITGFVLRYKILQCFSEGRGHEKLSNLAAEIFAVPDTKSVESLLDEFIRRREHLFLVVDEYGGTAGIITLGDAIETLLGVEIVDEFDSVDDMRKYALKQWERRKKGKMD